jgi:predicted transcriptional regulator
MDAQDTSPENLTTITADVVSAYVAKNSVQSAQLPDLIRTVHEALSKLGKPQQVEADKREPAVSIKKSVTPDAIISLFDGRRYKSLKRHLRVQHNMTPDEYRRYWNLPSDYPMVSPNYAQARSELARKIGLGQKGRRTKSTKRRTKKAA